MTIISDNLKTKAPVVASKEIDDLAPRIFGDFLSMIVGLSGENLQATVLYTVQRNPFALWLVLQLRPRQSTVDWLQAASPGHADMTEPGSNIVRPHN